MAEVAKKRLSLKHGLAEFVENIVTPGVGLVLTVYGPNLKMIYKFLSIKEESNYHVVWASFVSGFFFGTDISFQQLLELFAGCPGVIDGITVRQ